MARKTHLLKLVTRGEAKVVGGEVVQGVGRGSAVFEEEAGRSNEVGAREGSGAGEVGVGAGGRLGSQGWAAGGMGGGSRGGWGRWKELPGVS